MVSGIKAQITSQLWEKNTVILSLTRSPTNPVMCAHYTEGHRGVVFEIDTHAAGFTDIKTNMLPA